MTSPTSGSSIAHHSTWRTVLITSLVVATLVVLWGLAYVDRVSAPGIAGTLGVAWNNADRQERLAVNRLAIDSPLAVAGIKVGDRVRLDHRGDRARSLGTDELIGMTWYASPESEGKHLILQPIADPEVVAHPAEATATAILDRATALIMLGICFLIAWRQPDKPPLRALVVCLLYVHGTTTDVVEVCVVDGEARSTPPRGSLEHVSPSCRAPGARRIRPPRRILSP